ncbi:MAG: NDP-hexose 2,3-dehydratase family protein, partial [Bdellovibrionales bacterium]|nr:NDP-hexose 2,3-dehydratase family protein [Bdellovibrionales bacterium]
RHGGEPTQYLHWFKSDVSTGVQLSDSLQSEQGTRFLRKQNRNCTIEILVPSQFKALKNNWRWISGTALKELLLTDFAVNTDARSVLVCSPWSLLFESDPIEAFTVDGTLRSALRDSWVSDERSAETSVDRIIMTISSLRDSSRKLNRIPLNRVSGWAMCKEMFRFQHDEGATIRPFRIKVNGREVPEWDQPLHYSHNPLRYILLLEFRRGILHIFFKIRKEIGLLNQVELCASWQSSDEIEEPEGEIICSVRQSDEGGRFFQSEATYQIALLSENLPKSNHSPGYWITLKQAEQLSASSGYFTNEARSLLSLLLALT